MCAQPHSQTSYTCTHIHTKELWWLSLGEDMERGTICTGGHIDECLNHQKENERSPKVYNRNTILSSSPISEYIFKEIETNG